MKKLIIILFSLFVSSNLYAQYRCTFQLDMRQLLCNHTTEQGEDEVYILISGRSSTGALWNMRAPFSAGHFDLNDNGNNRQVQNFILAKQVQQELEFGGTAVLKYCGYGRRWGADWSNCFG
jgi:hypothetical protein